MLTAHVLRYRKDPYIVGEFGAKRADYGNDIVRAAYGMRDVQKEQCALGAKGYLFFTWDTDEPLASLRVFFRMTESLATRPWP